MYARNDDRLRKGLPKGIGAELRSISDAETDAMTETGAYVNSFIGSGSSLHKNGITELWRERC
jgi:hypothetical protein